MIGADIPFGDVKRFLSDRNGAVIRARAVELHHFPVERVPFNARALRVRDGGHTGKQGECEGKEQGEPRVFHAISFQGRPSEVGRESRPLQPFLRHVIS